MWILTSFVSESPGGNSEAGLLGLASARFIACCSLWHLKPPHSEAEGTLLEQR